MRQARDLLVVAWMAITLAGCDSTLKRDSPEYAEQQNEENFDSPKEERLANFVAHAVADQYAEIKLAELATTRSYNKQIQDFAQQMVNDHSSMLKKLQAIAQEKKITIPVEEPDDAKKTVNSLSQKQDQEFDKEWCNVMRSHYKKRIREWGRLADKFPDPALTELLKVSISKAQTKIDQLDALKNELM